MKAEKETLKQKLEIIEENKTYLESQKTEKIDPENFEKLQAVKHSLFEITEASIDIASHIIAAEGFQKPDEYAEMFSILSKNNVITEELSSKLKELARFRNLLVHRYGELEEEKLKQIINKDLKDVSDFATEIYRYMENEEEREDERP